MTSIEDARARVARAQEEKDGLYDKIRKKHGALADLDRDCGYERHSGQPDGPARKLRQAYNTASKELRLARSDLARMENEEDQKPKEYEVGVREDRDGITLTDVPDELVGELTGGTGKLIGPTPDGEGMIIELAPAEKGRQDLKGVMCESCAKQGMGKPDCSMCGPQNQYNFYQRRVEFREEVADHLREQGFDATVGEDGAIEVKDALPQMEGIDEDAEKERKARQLDLEGNPAPEVETGSETKEYRTYATESYRIKISEESLEKLLGKKDKEVLAWVQGHMRLLDPKRPVDAGVYDRDAKALYAKLRRA